MKFTPIVLSLLLSAGFIMCAIMLRKTVQKLLDFRGWKLKDALHISNGPWFRILARSVAVGSYSVLTMVACLILTFTPQGPAHDFVDITSRRIRRSATLPDLRRTWHEGRVTGSSNCCDAEASIHGIVVHTVSVVEVTRTSSTPASSQERCSSSAKHSTARDEKPLPPLPVQLPNS